MNATVTCEKCGKPLGVFDGNICYECEKKAHEDFKRYCTENNYVPLTTEMYSRAIKAMDALDKIRADIQENINYNKKMNYQGIVAGLLLTLDIIDKYTAESEDKE